MSFWNRLKGTASGPTTPQPSLRIDADWFRRAAFSPDGSLIVACGKERLEAWDATTGQPKQTIAAQRSLFEDLLFSPDGSYIACWGGHLHEDQKAHRYDRGEAAIWKYAGALSDRRDLPQHETEVESLVFLPLANGLAAVTAILTLRAQHLVHITDINSTKVGHTLTISNSIKQCLVAPERRTLAVVSESSKDHEGQVLVFDCRAGVRPRTTLSNKGRGLGALAFSKNGDFMAVPWHGVGQDGGEVQVFECNEQIRLVATLNSTQTGVFASKFSHNGDMLFLVSRNSVSSWDVRSRRKVWTLGVDELLANSWTKGHEAHNGAITSLAVHPIANLLAVSLYRTEKAINKAANRTAQKLGLKALEFFDFGDVSLLGFDGKLVIPTYNAHDSECDVQFSPDGKCLLTSSTSSAHMGFPGAKVFGQRIGGAMHVWTVGT